MARQVARHEPQPSGTPVVFFKASTGIDDLSWNSGFHLLASWALRLKGIPVAYFACHAGMSKCVLGTNRENVHKEPPCKSCIYQSKTFYTAVPHFPTPELQTPRFIGSTFSGMKSSNKALAGLSLQELMSFEWDTVPLGALCLPGLRWIFRIHHLDDDENTLYLFREYILSAWNVAQKFSHFLDETNPARRDRV